MVINPVTPINTASRFGHSFNTTMTMSFAPGAPRADCAFQWLERTDLPPAFYLPLGFVQYQWNDMYALYPQGFPTWNARVVPCPAGGPLTVVDTDPPALGIWPGRTASRVLDFDIIVRSGAGCACAFAKKEATATQTLQIINGTPTMQRFLVIRNNF